MSSKKDSELPVQPKTGFSRRGFIGGVGLGSGALSTGLLEQEAQAAPTGVIGPGAVPITLTVNGKPVKVTVEPRVTLVDALRNYRRPARVRHGGTAKLTAGSLAEIQTRAMNSGDHTCGNEDVYYPPLNQTDHAMQAYSLKNTYTGTGLDETSHSRLRRSAFIGTFHATAE